MNLLELPFILTFGCVLRFLFILGHTTDQDFHLVYTRWVKQSGLKHAPVPDSVMKADCGYPSFPHLLISLFPQKTWNLAGRLLNIFYDLASIAFVYFMSWHFVPADAVVPRPFTTAGWMTLLYATSPVLFPITARLKAMGGRTFGHLMMTVYFSILGFAWMDGRPWMATLCVPFGILTLIGSTFASQVLVLFTLGLSVYLWSPLPLAPLAASFAVAWLVPVLDFKPIFRYTTQHYRWYLQSIDKNSPIAQRNRLRNLVRLPIMLVRQPVTFMRTLFEHSSFFIAAYSVPSLTLLIFWWITRAVWPFLRSVSAEFLFLHGMLVSGVAAFFLTSFRPMTIWGQAERYLEFAVPWISPLFVVTALATGKTDVFFPVFLFQLLAVAFNFILVMAPEYLALFRYKPAPALGGALEAISRIESPRILTIPTKLAYLAASHVKSNNAKFCYDWLTEQPGGLSYMLTEREVYQYPKTDLAHFKTKYGVNTLLVEKKHIPRAEAFSIHYPLGDMSLLYENEGFAVYSLAPKPGNG